MADSNDEWDEFIEFDNEKPFIPMRPRPQFFDSYGFNDTGIILKVTLSILVIILSVIYLQNMFNKKRMKYVQGWPIFGSLHKFTKVNPHILLTLLRRQFGNIYRINIGQKKVVVVCSKQGIEEGLLKKGAVMCDRPDSVSANILYKGNRQNGVIMSDYTDKFQRKKAILHDCIYIGKIMSPQIDDKITEGLYKLAWEFQSHVGTPLNPRDLISCGIFNVLTWIVFNVQFEYNDQLFIKLLYIFDIRFKSAYSLKADYLPMLQVFGPCMKATALQMSCQLVKEFPTDQINDHKDLYDPDELNDVLDSFLYQLDQNVDLGVLNDSDIYYVLLDLIGHSFEPITATLEWALVYLANYPDIQRRVHEEIDEVVGAERFPCLEDRPMMPYTFATILEIQRMVTVMPFGLPHKTITATKFQGYDLPEGTNILFNFWSLNHDRRWWTKPGEFDPERFLTTDKKVRVPDYFMPYSEGRRKCLGPAISDATIFLFITCILHQLNVAPVLNNGKTSLDTEGEYINFVILPKQFEVCLTDRHSQESTQTCPETVPI
ncbi:cytochrome P450 2C5-like [Tubulanus polymorphus]|uniref:cytochrome P450 2C5-like n=1 Tax=Tubulanus polymorphus TaxID=672921 RepID=UPI003DA2A2F3